MEAAQLRELFADIGPLHNLDQVSAFERGDEWAVVLGGDVVTCELDVLRRVLVLSAEVGRPADEARARVNEALLQYNLGWRETGGVRMALDGPGGAVVQMYDLATAELDTARLGTVIAEFVALLRSWRELLARGPVPASAGEAGGLDPGFFGGAIRA